jgi:hypothetical protein
VQPQQVGLAMAYQSRAPKSHALSHEAVMVSRTDKFSLLYYYITMNIFEKEKTHLFLFVSLPPSRLTDSVDSLASHIEKFGWSNVMINGDGCVLCLMSYNNFADGPVARTREMATTVETAAATAAITIVCAKGIDA